MDLYSKPSEDLYITGITNWFWMPTGNTTRPAVAVTKNQGELWNSGYTLLVVLMFPAIGKINDLLLALFPLDSNGNRVAMLVAHYNNADPFSGTFMLRILQPITTTLPHPPVTRSRTNVETSSSRVQT